MIVMVKVMKYAAWIAAIAVFGAAEAATTQLVSIWFAAGAVAGLIAAILGASLSVQLWTFALVSAAALAATRPLVRRYASRSVVPTNADRVIGAVGRATEPVDGERGAVYADGKTWTARSVDGSVIPAQTPVRVERIEGVKLLVTRAETT